MSGPMTHVPACLACSWVRTMTRLSPSELPLIRLHRLFHHRRGSSCPFRYVTDLTSHEEVWHTDAPHQTANHTLNVTVEDMGIYIVTVTATGYPATGKDATLAVLANGLPRYRHGESSTWT